MMWPFKRHHAPSEEAALDATLAARALHDARNLDGRANVVAEALARQKRENHIAAAVRASMIPNRGTST